MNGPPPLAGPTSEDPITSQSAADLVRLIKAGELSSREIVEAHIRRIERVNPLLNAVVVRLFDDALKLAAAADEAQARGQSLAPLHGLPMTVKEMFDVKGTPTTAGLTRLAQTSATEDAPVVRQLRGQGAIILGKTNVPQFGLFYESDNPLYGKTNNPWNLDRSPGGSSGGEAAIIAACGSPLGLGSDGGGSIRQPAHSCGICGIKPGSHRLSMAGHFPCPNWHSDWVQPGPMARTVGDLRLAMRVLTGEDDASFAAADSLQPKRLRIGYYTNDGFFPPARAVQRAVEESVKALSKGGAEVSEFQPPALEDGLRIYYSLFLADGMRWMRRQVKDSAADWRVQRLLLGAQTPGVLRSLGSFLVQLLGQRYLARMSRWCGKRTLTETEYGQLIEQQSEYRWRFLREVEARKLDAILCPANALPALPHGSFYESFTGSYAVLYNLLGMPAGVVPVTRVKSGEETNRSASLDLVLRAAQTAGTGSVGLPVGVQVVAAAGCENTVLKVMTALEEQFRSVPEYPRIPVESGSG